METRVECRPIAEIRDYRTRKLEKSREKRDRGTRRMLLTVDRSRLNRV